MRNNYWKSEIIVFCLLFIIISPVTENIGKANRKEDLPVDQNNIITYQNNIVAASTASNLAIKVINLK